MSNSGIQPMAMIITYLFDHKIMKCHLDNLVKLDESH
jgi:hypothetical protein